mmetsp:Transcript_1916/g.5004  ORF Transcript_1916/g.5004 Transcript_1916/m.5004 type:complete len:95 (-) Transcript_1916:70-354(-)
MSTDDTLDDDDAATEWALEDPALLVVMVDVQLAARISRRSSNSPLIAPAKATRLLQPISATIAQLRSAVASSARAACERPVRCPIISGWRGSFK